jgi:hypothetical protein
VVIGTDAQSSRRIIGGRGNLHTNSILREIRSNRGGASIEWLFGRFRCAEPREQGSAMIL